MPGNTVGIRQYQPMLAGQIGGQLGPRIQAQVWRHPQVPAGLEQKYY